MNINELAAILHSAYHNAPDGAKVKSAHLFGIRYANELRHILLSDLVKQVNGIPKSYNIDIKQGMNLAEYVELDAASLWFGND